MSIPKYLTQIVASKTTEIADLKQQFSESSLTQRAKQSHSTKRSFFSALKSPGLSLIAEVKKASPSRGIIRSEFDPVQIAVDFEKKGARAISVLTDRPFFNGDLGYIQQIRDEVNVPILRKDFILDPIQVPESVLAGADAILLIMSILSINQAIELHQLATELGLSVLVETHTANEVEDALAIPGLQMIGINNRNLDTFEVDLTTSFDLISNHQSGLIWVSESGYDSPFQLELARNSGFDAVLIGEGLARNPELIDFFA